MNRKDATYVGIFLPHLDGTLERDVPNQHITLAFSPKPEVFEKLLPHIGEEVSVEVCGYGNDGKNEGLLVEIVGDIPYYGAENKHITLSMGQKTSAVKTGFIDFDKPVPDRIPLSMVGKVGVFTNKNEMVFDKEAFEEYKSLEEQDGPEI